MRRYRAVAGVALAVCLVVSTPSAVAAGVKANKAKANNQQGHAHHLLKAEEDLVAAEASIVAQNLAQAQKQVAAAIKQLEEAIAHHHKTHLATKNPGLVNRIKQSQHQHHHATLKQAVAELQAAEKQLQAGNGTKASQEIEAAAKTIKNAVASHHHLLGKA